MVTSSETLESVLWDRFAIREEFCALGKFATFPNYSRDTSDIVILGLSSRHLVVAKLILSGESVDYELVSMSPLQHLAIKIYNYGQKKLVVNSPYKVNSCVYQLCSCEDQEIIWEEFVQEIRKSLGQTYFCPALNSFYVDNKVYEIATTIPSDSKVLEAPCSLHDMNNNSVQNMNNNSVSVNQLSTADFAMGDYSLEVQTGLWENSFEDVEFDSFVNDTPKLGVKTKTPSCNIDTLSKDENVFSRFKERLKKLFQ